MCGKCSSYDISKTEYGNTFIQGHLSFRIFEFNDEDYTLFSYAFNGGKWELKYPIVNSSSDDIKVCVQEAIYLGISQEVRDCLDHRQAFLLYGS